MATFKIRAAVSVSPHDRSRSRKATMSDLAPDLPRYLETAIGPIKLQLAHADHLSPRAKSSLYKLFDRNMSTVSSGTSMVYDEQTKREELFDSQTRFLLLLRPSSHSPGMDTVPMPGALPRMDRKGKSRADVDFGDDDLVGFASLRFDTEETLSDRDVEVVYCYELQLSPAGKGQGFGKILMDELERIGRKRGMAKSMLTCLKANETALRFYTRQGYQPDEIDPTRMAEEESEDEDDGWQEVGSDGEAVSEEGEVDYTILSKNLQLDPGESISS